MTLCHCYSRNPVHKKAIVKWLGYRFNQAQIQWYIDKPSSTETPELNQLLKDIKHNKPKTVVVYSLDQISKSPSEGLKVLVDLLRNNGRIVIVDSNVDISEAFVADLLAAVSALGGDAWRERQAAGIEAAKERGAYKGRKKGALKPGIDLARVRELRDQGLTYDQLAKELGVARSTVIKYLKMG
jgi:DNA invertase Pin-like site-specific DNA recombinase